MIEKVRERERKTLNTDIPQKMEPYGAIRAEAQRWLGIAVKLLSGRDLVGSKTFAIRARESDPRLEFADQILAVADTLIAGEKRINNQPDWYAILQLLGRSHDSELIASQYRRLALLLNPHQNNLPFADLAFKLVCDAWLVLSNPSRKNLYDNEINFISVNNNNNNPVGGSSREHENRNQQQQQHHLNRHHQHQQQWQQPPGLQPLQQPPPQPPLARPVPQQPPPSRPVPQQPLPARPVPQQPVQPRPEPPPRVVQPEPQKQKQQEAAVKQSPKKVFGNSTKEVENGMSHTNGGDGDESPSFWTACPYCYNMYEYPTVYAECTLRCQNCKRAFQAVRMATRPPNFEGKEGYFSCWGFFPLGVSVSNSQKKKGGVSKWTPFSPMFTLPEVGGNGNVGGSNDVNSGAPKNPRVRKSTTPRVYVDDQDVYVEVSDGSDDTDDDDWRTSTRRKKAKSARGKTSVGRPPKQPQGDKAKNAKGGGGENSLGGVVMKDGVRAPNVTPAETSKKAVATNTRRQLGRGAKELGKLDLNVEFSNEVEEHAPGMSEGNGHGGPGHREEDNIEGMFFEGLDEFLSSLPILVGDDKVKAA